MPKCRDNRRRTARRRAKEQDRWLAKLVAKAWASKLCPKGNNPDYYEPYNVRVRGRGKHAKLVYRVRPNAKYRNLIKELIDKCKGVVVELPEDLFQERHQWN